MPTPVDSLTKESSDSAVREAISECIAIEIRADRPRDQAIAMCYEMARKKTGKELGYSGSTTGRAKELR